MGTMSDLFFFLTMFAAFYVVAMFGLNLGLARFVRARFARYAVKAQCNKYANHTTYVLMVGDATMRWTIMAPHHPSSNGKGPS